MSVIGPERRRRGGVGGTAKAGCVVIVPVGVDTLGGMAFLRMRRFRGRLDDSFSACAVFFFF